MTRKFRKMISLIVAMAVLLSATMVPSVAFGDSVSIRTSPERTIADAVLAGFGDYQYLGSTELKNLNGESEAVCFRYAPDAYVIVNHNDLSVPEYSPSNPSPFEAEGATEYIYNGPLAHFYKDSSNLIRDLQTEEMVDVNEIDIIYEQPTITSSQVVAKLRKTQYSTRASAQYMTNHTPVAWSADFFCGVQGAAIVLRYLYDYHSTQVLPVGHTTNGAVQTYLVSQKYIPDDGTTANGLLNGSIVGNVSYKGLNRFFADRRSYIRGSTRVMSNGDWTTVQNSFTSDYPVLFGTTSYNSWTYRDHWLIAYGYYYQDLSGGSLIVNDGWGHNNIHVTTDLRYYHDIVLFS